MESPSEKGWYWLVYRYSPTTPMVGYWNGRGFETTNISDQEIGMDKVILWVGPPLTIPDKILRVTKHE